MNNFCIFILTHGRPDNVITFKSLKHHGYTGKVYIVIDNEDKKADEYYKKFGKKNVIMFDKEEISKTFDQADNFKDRRSIVYARNACFKIAKGLGVKYFMQLDDDYTSFAYRYNDKIEYIEQNINIYNLDNIIKILLAFYKNTSVLSVAMAQGGDFIGGKDSTRAKKLKPLRKCMNTFICSTERPFKFSGRINEDVNTYTLLGGRGNLFLTFINISITQKQTQQSSGGMTDLYVDAGTYVKSFYTIIHSPSCTKIFLMGSLHKRLHHKITWKNAVPVILHESHKKCQ